MISFRYGLNYGAFDFLVDPQDQIWFLECNPIGQFAWIDFKTDLDLVGEMVQHLSLEYPTVV